jgi:hypothetical protein
MAASTTCQGSRCRLADRRAIREPRQVAAESRDAVTDEKAVVRSVGGHPSHAIDDPLLQLTPILLRHRGSYDLWPAGRVVVPVECARFPDRGIGGVGRGAGAVRVGVGPMTRGRTRGVTVRSGMPDGVWNSWRTLMWCRRRSSWIVAAVVAPGGPVPAGQGRPDPGRAHSRGQDTGHRAAPSVPAVWLRNGECRCGSGRSGGRACTGGSARRSAR